MNVLFLSTMLWDEVGGSFAPTRLSLELAARGHHILFLEHRASVARENRRLPIRIASLDEFGLPPFAISLAWRGVPLGSLEEITPRVAMWLDQNEMRDEPRVAILNSPFAPLARLIPFLQARGYRIVYYPQDNYAAMFALGMYQFNPQLERYLVTHADLNLALSTPVAEKLKPLGRAIALVPDAVDPAEFHGATQDPQIARGAECTLGFWGSLLEPMVDSDLLRALAQAKPQWTIHLFGPWGTPPQYPSVHEQLRDVPNIHFHGVVPHSELKKYAPAFDVCLIPAPDNDMSRGRDPIKLYEYLACYKPVVVMHMTQIQHVPYTRVALNVDECITAIEHARRETIDPHVIDSFLAQHTWSTRADTLLELLQPMMQQPPAKFGAFDAQELERVEYTQPVGILSQSEWKEIMYAVREHAKLARELESVQRWARELEGQNRTQQQTVTTRLKKIFSSD